MKSIFFETNSERKFFRWKERKNFFFELRKETKETNVNWRRIHTNVRMGGHTAACLRGNLSRKNVSRDH